MWWRKKKSRKQDAEQLTVHQEKTVRNIAEWILNIQRRWAAWMSSNANKMSLTTQKVALIFFVIIISLALIWPFISPDKGGAAKPVHSKSTADIKSKKKD